MTDNMKKFLEVVSQSEELAARANANKNMDAIIALAKEQGITLTAADFRNDGELSDDELDVVVGGQAVNCSCALGGGGSGDENDKTCACVAAGFGYSKNGSERCFCAIAGFGYDW